MTHSTNYLDTFITVAPDCTAREGKAPKEAAKASATLLAFQLVHEHPYRFTSDDVLFAVHTARAKVPGSKASVARKQFFSKPHACLRASDLGKRYGWGIHSDARGRVALYALETAEYARFASGKDLDGKPITVKHAMRSQRPESRGR